MEYSYGYTSQPGLLFWIVYWFILCVLSVILIVSMCKLFSKAGEEGWKAIIPYYNIYIWFRITFGSGWKMLWLLVPFVNLVFIIRLYLRTAKVFGKGTGFGIGLIFFPYIFFPILAFGNSEYTNIY